MYVKHQPNNVFGIQTGNKDSLMIHFIPVEVSQMKKQVSVTGFRQILEDWSKL